MNKNKRILLTGISSIFILLALSYQNCGKIDQDQSSDSKNNQQTNLLLKSAELPEAKQKSYEGNIEIDVADFFETKRTEITYRLLTKDGRTIFLKNIDSKMDLKNGDQISVSGSMSSEREQSFLTISDLKVLQKSKLVFRKSASGKSTKNSGNNQLKSAPDEPVGTPNARTLALILVNFAENPIQPITVPQFIHQTFTNDPSVYGLANGFYQESTYNNILFQGILNPNQGDGFGWYTIPTAPAPCYEGHFAFSSWVKSQVMPMAAADGLVEADYDHIMIAWPTTDCGEGFGGLATGLKYSFINSTVWHGTVIHELGHNLGLSHSNRFDCVDQNGNPSTSGNCTEVEYGDPYSIMGHGYKHFTMHEKEQLGVLVPAQVKNIAFTNAVFDDEQVQIVDLAPSETYSTMHQWIKVGPYNLEYRRRYGVYDNFPKGAEVIHGLSIRRGRNLLDMHPLGDPGVDDYPLAIGETFEGSDGIKITLLQPKKNVGTVLTDTYGNPSPSAYLRVKIELAPYNCTGDEPSIVNAPFTSVEQKTLFVNGYIDIPVVVTNNNPLGCNRTDFTVESVVPTGFSIQWLDNVNIHILPGESTTLTARLTADSNNLDYGVLEFDFAKVTDNIQPTIFKKNKVLIDYIPTDCVRNQPLLTVDPVSIVSVFPLSVVYSATNQDSSSCPLRHFYLGKEFQDIMGGVGYWSTPGSTFIDLNPGEQIDHSAVWNYMGPVTSGAENIRSAYLYTSPIVYSSQFYELEPVVATTVVTFP